MIRVLHVFHKMSNGGIEQFVMNYYRHIDRNSIQFDFLTSVPDAGYFDQEILSYGGKLFHAYSYEKNPVRAYHEISQIVKQNQYQIVHRHTGSAFGYFDLRAAKSGGAKHLILHAHNTEAGRKALHFLSRKLLSFECIRAACSQKAGEFLFGKHLNFTVIKNAIDVQKFKYDEQARDRSRKEFGCNNKYVIGHVGRFSEQKNHRRLLSIFSEIYKRQNNSVLICVGDGKLLSEIKHYAEELRVAEHVRFLGQREDVEYVLNACDVFLLPSLFEGLGISLIEAQANGLPCFASKDLVPEEVNITENIRYISLDESDSYWAEAILSGEISRYRNTNEKIRQAGYDIKTEAVQLQRFYQNLVENPL